MANRFRYDPTRLSPDQVYAPGYEPKRPSASANSSERAGCWRPNWVCRGCGRRPRRRGHRLVDEYRLAPVSLAVPATERMQPRAGWAGAPCLRGVRSADGRLARLCGNGICRPRPASEAREMFLHQPGPVPTRSLRDLLAALVLDHTDLKRCRCICGPLARAGLVQAARGVVASGGPAELFGASS